MFVCVREKAQKSDKAVIIGVFTMNLYLYANFPQLKFLPYSAEWWIFLAYGRLEAEPLIGCTARPWGSF